MIHRIYCGGRFCFDYLDADYRIRAAEDYRAQLLGDPALLLQHSEGVPLHAKALYTGPFYFESDGMVDTEIVRSETEMVRSCTDAIFLLDDAACPGTICELTMAGMLGKAVHIFFIRRADGEETESALHTPCWFPILHSCQVNPGTRLYPCASPAEASERIRALIAQWQT